MTAFAPATILIQHFLSPLTLKDKEKINIYLFACINLIRCKIPFVLIIVRSVKFLTIASLISHLSFQSKCDQKQCQCCQQEFSSQHCPPKPLTPPPHLPIREFPGRPRSVDEDWRCAWLPSAHTPPSDHTRCRCFWDILTRYPISDLTATPTLTLRTIQLGCDDLTTQY